MELRSKPESEAESRFSVPGSADSRVLETSAAEGVEAEGEGEESARPPSQRKELVKDNPSI